MERSLAFHFLTSLNVQLQPQFKVMLYFYNRPSKDEVKEIKIHFLNGKGEIEDSFVAIYTCYVSKFQSSSPLK